MIRKASKDDIVAIQAMHTELAQLHSAYAPILEQNADAEQKYLDCLEKQFSLPYSYFFVYETGKKIVGYCHILIAQLDSGLVLNNRCFINDFFVSSANRNNGIGKKTLEYILHFAKEKECQYVNLNVILRNENAVRFWQKTDLFHYLPNSIACYKK